MSVLLEILINVKKEEKKLWLQWREEEYEGSTVQRVVDEGISEEVTFSWKNQKKLYRAKEQWVKVLSNDIREVKRHKPRPSKQIAERSVDFITKAAEYEPRRVKQDQLCVSQANLGVVWKTIWKGREWSQDDSL